MNVWMIVQLYDDECCDMEFREPYALYATEALALAEKEKMQRDGTKVNVEMWKVEQ